jgi:uncharacterized protein with PIN domain
MKLLLDEMLSPTIAQQLRAHGYDVIAVTESPDLRSLSDAEILAIAVEQRRCVVTRNISDFRRLTASMQRESISHSGLILIASTRFPEGSPHSRGRLIARILKLLESNRDLTDAEVWLT